MFLGLGCCQRKDEAMRYGWMMGILLLAGCATATETNAPSQGLKEYDYTCEDRTRLKVVFEDNHAVVTLNDGKVLVLPQMPSGSGIRYATPRHELRGTGNDATWTVGRKMAVECRTDS
ncbi:MAG: hypothetical protein EON60_03850 [Alphaproteobacteria bacterium]|nr:MAG: hypothetical protein EON60_03850 [Alphaproteobacteria bacterium]